MIQKPLPNNIQAEQAVLGSGILKSDVLYEISEVLKPEDFYLEKHQKLYKIMLELLDEEGAFDLIMLIERLKERRLFDNVGKEAYLVSLIDTVPAASNAIYYAKIMKKKAELRNLYAIFYKSMDKVLEEAEEPTEIALSVENKFSQLITPIGNEKVGKIGDFYDEFIEKLGDVSVSGDEEVLLSGYPMLDEFMYGFAPSDFVVIAGRPGMGKTQFFLNLMKHIAIDKKAPILFFSIEMSKYQIFERFAGIFSGISLKDIRKGKIGDFLSIQKPLEILKDAPLYIDDTPRLSIFNLRLKAKRFVAQAGIKAVFVDHMQLITGSKGDRYHQITEYSGALKGLAKELDIPVIVASQLSRGVEQRQKKEPILSDLRESGAIEQDADKVIFLHRDDYYKKEETGFISDLKVHLAKNRDGDVGETTLIFNRRTGVMNGFGKPYGDDPENPF